MRVALSSCAFLRTMMGIWGKALDSRFDQGMDRASTAQASGSGTGDTYTTRC